MAIQPVNNLIVSSDPGYQADNSSALNVANDCLGIIGNILIQGSASSKLISSAGGKILWRNLAATWATAGSTISIGIQDVDTTTGLQDGTFDVKTDMVQGVDAMPTTQWILTSMASGSKTISDGDLIAIVISMPIRNGADVINPVAGAIFNGIFPHTSNFGFPYGTTSTTGTVVKNGGLSLFAIIVFDDGTLGWIYGMSPILTATVPATIAYNSGSSPDEYIGTFVPNYSMQISGIGAALTSIQTTDNFEIILYSDPYGTPVALQTIAADPDVTTLPTSAISSFMYRIPPTTLTAGATYGIAIRPTTVNNISWAYNDLQSSAIAAIMKGIMPLPQLKMAGRTNQTGAFVEVAAQDCPIICVNICGLNDGGASSSSGGAFVF